MTKGENNVLNEFTTMKKSITVRYSAPEIRIAEVVAERGYGDSVALPGFGSESDEFVY